jgi:hypothetical protein
MGLGLLIRVDDGLGMGLGLLIRVGDGFGTPDYWDS